MPDDQHIMREWGRQLSETVTVSLVCAGNAGDEAFLRFCTALSECAPRVDVRMVTEGPEGGPAIEIRRNLRYRAVPAGPELSPFLEALSGASSMMPTLDAAPKVLRLYIADGCPFCPAVVRRIIPMAADPLSAPAVDLSIVDAARFPDDASDDGVKSVPTLVYHDTVLDTRLRWSGMPDVDEILSTISAEDPSRMGAGAMAEMIHEGDAQRLADMMLASGRLFPAIIDLLTHEKWPTRLGAMVVAETLADESRAMADALVGPLTKRFHQVDDTVQGDVLWVLGMAGDHRLLPWLDQVMSSPVSPEVAQAAREAAALVAENRSESGTGGKD